jgi:putative PIN family toxin of toxin-antitoxin system
MKLVVDTSTIIRGLTRKHSEPAYIIDQIVNETFSLVMCDEMAKELVIAIYIMCERENINPKKYLRAISIFILHSQRINITTNFTSCSDPEDKMFIECAIDGGVESCISSDPSIYDIKRYCTNQTDLALIKDIQFYHPQSFYNFITAPTT